MAVGPVKIQNFRGLEFLEDMGLGNPMHACWACWILVQEPQQLLKGKQAPTQSCRKHLTCLQVCRRSELHTVVLPRALSQAAQPPTMYGTLSKSPLKKLCRLAWGMAARTCSCHQSHVP